MHLIQKKMPPSLPLFIACGFSTAAGAGIDPESGRKRGQDMVFKV